MTKTSQSLIAKERYQFKKNDKLKSRKAIEAVFTRGKSFSLYPFRVVWMPKNEFSFLQAGVGVSSRQFKKAVDRNRIKRLMREAWRLQKNPLRQLLLDKEKQMSVFILYIGKEITDYKFVSAKMSAVIQRLQRIINE